MFQYEKISYCNEKSIDYYMAISFKDSTTTYTYSKFTYIGPLFFRHQIYDLLQAFFGIHSKAQGRGENKCFTKS